MSRGIKIGKQNCINDTAVYLNMTLPNINEQLAKSFAIDDYEAMQKEVERLKRVTSDLEDMVNELQSLKK